MTENVSSPPAMSLEGTIQIDRSADRVFQFLTDYGNDPAWRTGVKVMRSDGPVVVGARTHEELTFLGSTYITQGTVTERTPTRLAFRGENASVRSEGFREAIPEGGGTRVTYVLHLEPRGMLRLFAGLLERIYARRIARDLARLKAILEA